MTVGESFEKAATSTIPWKKIAMKLFSQVSQDRLAEIMSPEGLAAITEQDEEEFSERAQAEWEKLAEKTVKTHQGKVTFKNTIITKID